MDDRGGYGTTFRSGLRPEHASVAFEWGSYFQVHVLEREDGSCRIDDLQEISRFSCMLFLFGRNSPEMILAGYRCIISYAAAAAFVRAI
jgi:hypothetical protein